MEIWKPIKDYEGLYQVSNLGRVKSLERIDSLGHKRKEKIFKPRKDKYGYLRVSLWKDGKGKMVSIHRLVAIHFIPNPDNLPEVNHKDENKENNTLSNLEWCDRKYNNNYGTRIQRFSESHKGKHHTEETKKKISEAKQGKPISEEVKKKMSESHKGENNPNYGTGKPIYCMETNKTYPNASQCAEELGLWAESIRAVCKGKYKQTGGYHFYYKEDILYMN